MHPTLPDLDDMPAALAAKADPEALARLADSAVELGEKALRRFGPGLKGDPRVHRLEDAITEARLAVASLYAGLEGE